MSAFTATVLGLGLFCVLLWLLHTGRPPSGTAADPPRHRCKECGERASPVGARTCAACVAENREQRDDE